MDLKTKKLVNRNIWIKKGGLVALKKYEDKDCRYYYVKSLRRRVNSFQLVEDALDIEPSLEGNDKIRPS